MKQAVLVDYTGTLVKEDGPDLHGVVRAICANSDEKDPRRALAFWWQRLKQYEAASFGPAFLTQDEIVQRILADCERQLHLQADKAALHAGLRRFWASAPLFEDAPAFFAACPVPVWVLTNNSEGCVRENLAAHGIVPAGIVTGDMARAYKPHRAFFEKALALSGCTAGGAVHIGDSARSDIEGARAAGIEAVLLCRGGQPAPCGVRAAQTLPEALALALA